MKNDFTQSYTKWKRKWKSLHWKEGGLEDKINFYDYCIDESNDGKFKSDKSEKNCEIPRLSLLSETIKSLDYLDEYHIIDRERRRKIEDFLLILRWYDDKKCGRNNFWRCLIESSNGLSAVASKAIKYLDEGVELKTVEIKINSRENAESVFGIAIIRLKIRKIISSNNYVTSGGKFSSAAASKFLSGKKLRCKDIVEEEIIRKISGIETEGRIPHFKINFSRRQMLKIAEMCGWEEPGTNMEDSVYKLLVERRKTRLKESKRVKKKILQYFVLFGKIRTFDLAAPILENEISVLSSVRRIDEIDIDAKKQQQYNLGNIAFPSPTNWDDDDGFILSIKPVFGDYRTDSFEIVTDLQDKEVIAKPEDWFRLGGNVWRYAEEEINDKYAINEIFHFLLNNRQRESLSRYEMRLEKFLHGSNRTNNYGSVRSPYPLFLPLGNAVRDIQNYWNDQNRKITGEYYVRKGRGN